MTNRQIIELWEKFLEEECQCFADQITGNRPCDNGCFCDKCLTDEIRVKWNKILLINQSVRHNAAKRLKNKGIKLT